MRELISRRRWFRYSFSIPFAAWLNPFRELVASHLNRIRITAIKAMQLKGIAGNCLIKIETDEGLIGYGEAGATGPMARAHINAILKRGLLVGQDPLSISRHFHEMSSLMYTYRPHIPTISGIDIALWDLAGKITGLPVNVLMGGAYRDAIPMYSHAFGFDPFDLVSCEEWVQRVRSMPQGFSAFKMVFARLVGIPLGKESGTLDSQQIRRVATALENVRRAAGDDIDIALHCHGEMDTPSAIAVGKAIQPSRPLFYEDPIKVLFCDGWLALKRSIDAPILTGEKLEMLREFRPFLDSQVVDIIHPDLAFAGGITGTRQIAEYAQISRIPVALHNVGSLVLCYASAHFGSAIHNFYRSESALGRPSGHVEKMSPMSPPVVKDSFLKVPDGPGLGFEPDEEYLRSQLSPGEPFWS